MLFEASDGARDIFVVVGLVDCRVVGKNDAQMALSAYRFHEEDPIAFVDGVRFEWRIGDVMNPKTHPESPKCFIDELDVKVGDKISAGGCANTTVWSYAWVYVWPGD